MDASQGKAGFSRSKLFRWGIVFWIVAWIGSVWIGVRFDLSIKGCKEVTIEASGGSVHCIFDGRVAPASGLGSLERIRGKIPGESAAGIWARLASGGWNEQGGATYVSFPNIGFLWLWLVLGWASKIEFRRLFRIETGKTGNSYLHFSESQRRMTLLVSLAVGTIYFSGVSQEARDTEECRRRIWLIQATVDNWIRREFSGYFSDEYTGKPIMWRALIGKGSFIEPVCIQCPSGGDFELSSVIPKVGDPAAKCPHPEHQEYILKKGIIAW